MSSCYYDYQCRKPGQGWKNEGRGCREGRCYELISVSGTGNCDYQEQCPGQSICMEHHCVAAEPTNSNCRMQSDCGIGERCIGDTCFSPAPYLPNIGGHYRRQPRPVTSSAYDHDSYEPPLRCPDFLVCPVDCCTAGCPYAHCCCHGPSFYHH
uniref:WAP domain-containing protein n=1 Tax=Trichuris muris TaxID=70415 RepID=A0A5S6R020_TRIMR